MNTSSNTHGENHYFTAQPTGESHRRQFTVKAATTTLTLTTDSGVFSQHGLDKGTAVFLDAMRKVQLPPLPDGSTLCDVGCGTGAIALTLAVLFPNCTIVAVDVNERARQLCAENARANSLSNVRVLHPDEIPTDFTCDLLWSNPPIRIGKDALHELLLTWLNRLSEHGVAHLVVSKNLGADSLAEWLRHASFSAHKLSSSKGFRVLEVRKHQ